MDEDNKMVEEFLDELIKEKGGSRNDFHLLKDKIAWIESKGDPSAIQKSSRGRKGPGRGKYQFEMIESEDGIKGSNRAKDAKIRTLRSLKEYGMKAPKWLKNLRLKDNFDASTLTDKQQDLLFFGDLKGSPNAKLKDYTSGNTSAKDLWLDAWWVGNRKSKDFKNERQSKADMWDEHQSSFKPVEYNPPQAEPVIPGFKNDYKFRQLGPVTNQNAYGGSINNSSQQEGLNSFRTGGSHEASPHGGIPLGIGANGKMNTVEQGETSHKFDGMKYIFSKRIKI